MTSLALAPEVTPQLGGVYQFRHLIGGRPVFYALSPAGELLAPGLRVVQTYETEDDVVAELVPIARRAARPQLRLIK